MAKARAVGPTRYSSSPWIPASSAARFARVAVIETVIARVEAAMREWGIEPPEPLDEDD